MAAGDDDAAFQLEDKDFDVIILGTGLKECVMAGLCAVRGKKVLHLDRNKYYGGECASLDLKEMFERFRDNAEPPAALGRARDYRIDLIPKFVMASGLLVDMLIYSGVNRYLDFKSVDGSYVVRDGKPQKVPSNATEALSSGLIGFFEKRRLKNFYQAVLADDVPREQFANVPMRAVYAQHGLDATTQEVVGHAMALYTDEQYQDQPAIESVDRIRLYANSLLRYKNAKSPYLYPLYGLGDLPQAFARLSAINGSTYMLRTPVDEVLYGADGKVTGVRARGQTLNCKQLIADPSYFPTKVRRVGQVARCICILSHPIPNTDNTESCQIIIPQSVAKRRYDIYISCVSYAHNVAPEGKWLAIVSTTVETSEPLKELNMGLALLGPIDDRFPSVSDLYEPIEDGRNDNVFISKSYDAASHFESATQDCLELFERVMGEKIDFSKPPPSRAPEVSGAE